MDIKGFGVNTRRTDGDFQKLERQFAYLKEAGFEYLEVSADVADTIAGGYIVTKRMDKLLQLLHKYDFKYTAHIQNGVDLRDPEDSEFQLKSLKSGIDFAGIIGAEILVCHYEKQSEDQSRESLFRRTFLEGLEHARKKWNIKLGVENIEIELLSSAADFVREINEPDVVLVLDIGHAFLSERYFGKPFLDSIRYAADVVGHIHLSDNFGRFDKMRLENFDLYRVSNYTNRLNLGKGDLNLPPGWGSIPLKKVIEVLKRYSGIIILEYYHDKYLEFNSEILRDTQILLSGFKKSQSFEKKQGGKA
ncbi:MAG: hypothetical protein DRP87_05210 [Spirochaetes bacterium]|nr:MAG: hypothetical protein DRP87_05210 [Spirochaetota bacterium]